MRNPVAWYRWGFALFQLRRYGEALEAFDRASTLDFLPEEAMYEAARVHGIWQDEEAAMQGLMHAAEAGLRGSQRLEAPEFDALREHPRWSEVQEALSR